MADPDKIMERKEKLGNFLKIKLGFDRKYGPWYLGVYILIMAVLFLYFGKMLNSGKLWLFVIIPFTTLILFLLGKINLGVLINLVGWGFIIRIQNLPILKDVTTGGYIPSDLDAFAFLRYAQYILEHGKLMAVDTMRYYPLGFTGLGEFKFLSYFIVYLYKFLHFFSSSITLELADVLYPAVATGIGVVFFYLFVKKLFNARAALIASAFLIVVPAFLYRSMGGVSDKEALGIMFMFAAFYFYISSLKAEKIVPCLAHGFFAAVSTGLMGLSWGGVTTIFLVVGLTIIVELFLGKLKRKDVYAYALFIFVLVFILTQLSDGRFNFGSLITSFTSGIMFIALGIALVNLILFDLDLLKIKEKVQKKYPAGVFSSVFTLIIGLIAICIAYGPGYIILRVGDIYTDLIEPFGKSRWALTVAENQQPYLVDWVRQFNGWLYVWLFIIGSVFLFYLLVRNLKKKNVWMLTSVYMLFILGLIFSRYDTGGVFDGVSTLSKLVYLGSIILFFVGIAGFYVYFFYKDKEEFNKILNFDKTITFVVILFVITAIAARGAIRLLFLLAPTTALIGGFFIDDLIKKSKSFPNNNYLKKSLLLTVMFYLLILLLIPKLGSEFFASGFIAAALGFILASFFGEIPERAKEVLRIILYCMVIFISVSLLFTFTRSTIGQAASVGPPYHQQWQEAGGWVRDNTPENAVFAHWWDYGYWVQTGWKRATISDGGNARGAINYFIGRHVLTGEWDREKGTSTEALQLLKANGVTNLLIVADEIGKYTAYSSIGSDVNYDRYSWINTYGLDRSQTRETRNQTVYTYTGGTPLDEDLVYNNQVYPSGAAGVAAFFVPIGMIQGQGNNSQPQMSISQPIAVVVYNGQRVDLPIECVYFNGILQYYPNAVLKGCLRFIPAVSGNQMDPLASALYLSPRVSKTLFAHLYLFGEGSENFKLVYSDESRIPLAVYNGRPIGPIKIWEMNYPENLEIPKEFYGTELPDPRVDIVGR